MVVEDVLGGCRLVRPCHDIPSNDGALIILVVTIWYARKIVSTDTAYRPQARMLSRKLRLGPSNLHCLKLSKGMSRTMARENLT